MDSIQIVGLALRSLWRYKFSAAVIFSLTILLVLCGIAICPRKYRSAAKVFVRLGRETVTLDPTATTGQTVAVQTSREIEVRSVRDMLTSRQLMEKVVDEIGIDYVLDPPFDSSLDASTNATVGISSFEETMDWLKQQIAILRDWAQQVRLSDPVPERELAIRNLEKRIKVDGGTKSSVISIEYSSASPTAAQRILEHYLDAYRVLHVRVNRTPENYAFFEKQSEELRVKLENARLELEKLKNEKGVVAIEIRKQDLQEHIGQLEVKVRESQARLAAADASLTLSKKALEKIPERLLTDQVQGIGDPARDSIRGSLYQLEIEAERVKQAYAEGHPERERVLAQVESMRKIYESESTERPTQTETANPAYQELQLKIIEIEASKAGIVAELAALRDQQNEVAMQLRELNNTELLLASLQEKVDLLKDNHREYSENLELSRIDEELKQRQISNVSVVQPPSLVMLPVSPNKKLVGVAGLLLGMMNALAFAMWRNRRELSLPLSVSQPQMLVQQPSTRLNQRAPLLASTRQVAHSAESDAKDNGSTDENIHEDLASDDNAGWDEIEESQATAPR